MIKGTFKVLKQTLRCHVIATQNTCFLQEQSGFKDSEGFMRTEPCKEDLTSHL